MKRIFKFAIFCMATAGPVLQDANALEVTQSEILGKKSNVNFNALVQGWAIGELSTNFRSGASDSAYRLRRAELKLTGIVGELNRWFVMADASKALKTRISAANADTNPLQEFGLGVGIFRGLELVIGQYKPPTMAEALEPSAGLLLPERSLSGRTFGYRRELGAMLAYRSKFFNILTMVSSGRDHLSWWWVIGKREE